MKTAFLRSWRLANAPPIAVPPQAYQNLHYQWTDLRKVAGSHGVYLQMYGAPVSFSSN